MQNYFESGQLPLFAADFEYYRLPPERWELMLIRLKQLGVNAITISIPWGFHEFDHSTIDLSGLTHTRRDVKRVLNLCQDLSLPCILEVGPYSPNNILGDGLPFWLWQEAGNLEASLPSTIEGWYKAMSTAIAGYQWPAGPIIALQVNSEPMEGRPLALSDQLAEVEWPIWLRKRYEDLEALNRAYGTDYRTVHEVKIPKTGTEAGTLLEKDAAEFLEKARHDIRANYTQILVEAGWQIPVYPSAPELHPDLPGIQSFSLTKIGEFPSQNKGNTILNLKHPIQVDPDPADVGQRPAWASNAPIRTDGSLRRTFWILRHTIWSSLLSDTVVEDKILVSTFDKASMVTCSSDTKLKVDVPGGPQPTAYRLRLNGDLFVDDTLKVRRGKMSGPYQTEDETDQTDLLFLLSDPTGPLTGFSGCYLADLLTSQVQTLTRAAILAESLGQQLTLPQNTPVARSPHQPAQTLNTLEEARRGLREADTALKKAMSSIGGLEHGLGAILDKDQAKRIPQPAAAIAEVTPETFEGPAREILLEIGELCRQLAPQLASTAATLQGAANNSGGFTLMLYQQSYAAAVDTAQAIRRQLLGVVTMLRLEIGSERLPRIIWRVHDQVQEIAETLRWGVLRK